MNFSEFIFYFTAYSILGWIVEATYCSILAKKFLNRGFLAGPYCPIYGLGSLIIVFLLLPFTHNIVFLFLIATLSTTALEYLTGWIMEELFSIRWWDYSDKKFNIKGRICLENSIMFGILGVLLCYFIHPVISNFILAIPYRIGQIIASLIVSVFVIDFMTTLNSLFKLHERLRKFRSLLETLEMYNNEYSWLDRSNIKESLIRLEKICIEIKNEDMLQIIEKLRGLMGRKNPGRRLIGAFPNMKHKLFSEHLSSIKAELNERINKIDTEIKKTFNNKD